MAGDGRESETQRHIKRLALARLFRLMQGLQKKECPVDQWGNCYWCGAGLFWDGRYVGNLRGQHHAGCLWNEVIDYQYLEDEWLVREKNGAGSEQGDERDAGQARLPDGEDGAAGERVRPVD